MTRLIARRQLRGVFDEMANSNFCGVEGVKLLPCSQGTADKTVVISAMCHGNEPAGLAALGFLIQNQHLIKNADVLLLVANMDAGARFFKATTPEEKHACRYTDWNMNRIPNGFGVDGAYTGKAYELVRAQKLWDRVLGDATHFLDIHSADDHIPGGLLIDVEGDLPSLNAIAKAMPIQSRMTNCIPLMRTSTAKNHCFGNLVGHGKGISMSAEAGAHEDEPGLKVATLSALSYLAALDCLDAEFLTETSVQKTYPTIGFVYVPNGDYRVVDEAFLKTFAPVTKGQPIAVCDGSEPVVAAETGYLVFGPGPSSLQAVGAQSAKEELFFCLGPVEDVERTAMIPRWFADLK